MVRDIADPEEALDESRIFLDLLGPNPTPTSGNKAAEWRLRVTRQRTIDDRLSSIGKLALLGGGSLLVTLQGNHVEKLQRTSNWRETLHGSPMWKQLNVVKRGQLTGAKYENYTRIESSIQSLAQMMCLAVKNVNDSELVKGFNEFKVACVKHAFASDRTTDEVIEHIKTLGKIAQACLLGTKIEPLTGCRFCPMDEQGSLLPFKGEFQLISEIYNSGRRTGTLSYRQAFMLAQVGQLPRSLPYPSTDQVKASLKETFRIIQTQIVSNPEALTSYRKGLQAVKTSIPRPKTDKSHVSLLGSGARENSRSQGGRAGYLVRCTRHYGNKILDESYRPLVGKRDQFAKVILKPETWAYLESIGFGNIMLPIANAMYLELHEAPQVLKDYREGRLVPKHLGDLINLTASMLIRELGEYSELPSFHNGIMYFNSASVKFICAEIPTVRADVSIESGLKARLTTSGMAAFAHLSQLPANFMRSWLSKDPFHRVGFEESDKLWEVLKTYRKRTQTSSGEGK